MPARPAPAKIAKAAPAKPEASPAAAQPAKLLRNRKGDEARARILDAALDSFGAFGFEGTSTRAIAQSLGIGHTLVIYHFRTKDLLWIATMERLLGVYAGAVQGQLADSDTQPAKIVLTRFVDTFVRMSARYPQMHRIMTMQSNQGTDRLQWVIDHFLRDHFNSICDLIRRGQREGSVRDADPARLYYLIIAAGGTPFTVATEYQELTGRDVFGDPEILRNIAFILDIVLR
jgi:AcrR family transcriptional regulator